MKYFLFFIYSFFLGIVTNAQIVNVSTATQLKNALDAAQPGQTIVLADGVYDLSSGIFVPPIGVDGTPSQPITVKGSRNAVLTTGTHVTGYGFQFKGNKYWILKGFTVRNCKNGIVVDSSQYITIDSIKSVYTGQSGINLRRYSSYCTVQNCFVDSAGILDASYGEGIYVGSANSNWCENTYCNVDTCNYNKIYKNSFGSYVLAENIDVKEGTKYGIVRGNNFNGTGLAGMNGGDSWIDVKGNYWVIEMNTGTGSILDGFQTHIVQPGWGNYNTFNQNILNVNASGYGIRITTSNSNGTALNNIVCNSNTQTGATLGLTNTSTQTCNAVLANELLQWNAVEQNSNILFSWRVNNASQLTNFVIEQSKDGRQFQQLAKVDVSGLQYSMPISKGVVIGNCFRLALKSKDGSFSYSPIACLTTIANHTVKVFQNGGAVTIQNGYSTNCNIRIMNMQGHCLLSSIAKPGINNFYVNQFPKGVYMLEAIPFTGQGKLVVKFTL